MGSPPVSARFISLLEVGMWLLMHYFWTFFASNPQQHAATQPHYVE